MAGSFEKLVKSQDIFISSQQSGDTGASAKQEFNSFKVCFNQHPLTCSANQFVRLSLTQFWSYRNWYYVNKTNNLFVVRDSAGNVEGDFSLSPKDYGNIGDISTEFGTQLAAAFTAMKSTGNFPAVNFSFTSTSTAPTTTGGTGDRLMRVRITGDATVGNFVNAVIQTPQYYSATENDFNDSYALLGGKRVSDGTDKTTKSFTITNPSGNHLDIVGFFPIQRTTTPFLYLRCSHNGSNLETQNNENYQSTQDEHIINSTIIAKLPVSDTAVSLQFDALSPYFVDLESRFISELDFRITDGHGRPIPLINQDVDIEGNLFVNMTIKANTYETPPSPYELQTSPPPVPLFDKEPYNLTYLSQQRPNPFARNI